MPCWNDGAADWRRPWLVTLTVYGRRGWCFLERKLGDLISRYDRSLE